MGEMMVEMMAVLDNSQPCDFDPVRDETPAQQGFRVERTTGFEPATLTLGARTWAGSTACSPVHTVRPCQARQSTESLARVPVSRQLSNAFNYSHSAERTHRALLLFGSSSVAVRHTRNVARRPSRCMAADIALTADAR
jgi:hypothetical protein